ncbi:MAG: Lrp/AsnC family transcriptional regulator [Opitutales bacterium]|jgi:DNA-binding Lrp family transcriptional regulator
MNSVLQLLLEGERLETDQMADILGMDSEEVERELSRLRSEGILLGWRPVFNPAEVEDESVRAVIEVKISPEREGGFDRLALRVSRFEEVESCYLMSGGYDLLVIVEGKNLRSVASFVSERLATIAGVLSTSTHFLLRAYKEQRHLLVEEGTASDKPAVSP